MCEEEWTVEYQVLIPGEPGQPKNRSRASERISLTITAELSWPVARVPTIGNLRGFALIRSACILLISAVET